MVADQESVEKETENSPSGREASQTASVSPEIEAEELRRRILNPTNPNFKWYVVNTYSGHENKAKQSLIEHVKMSGHTDLFGEMIVPTANIETVSKGGKKKQISRTQYPGYFYLQMDLNDKSLSVVKKATKISGFVGGNQQRPRPLPDHEILRIAAPELAARVENAAKAEIIFDKGTAVKVIDGPFSNFDGIVDEVKPDKARLRVLVSIFGRETPVELEYRQVQKI